ncbi:MAG: hypothetical protein IT245_04925 [Bacteroidia bacterium]|nr:hypothetical protein [Bacteroidia bacterium]
MKQLLHITYLLLMLGGVVVIDSCKPKKMADKPISKSESSFDNYFIDAVTHFNNSNFETALKLFNKCIEINPSEASTYYYISKINFNDAAFSEIGLQYASKAYNLAPNNPEFAMWYSRNLKIFNNLDKAIEVLENSLKSNPKDDLLINELDALYAKKSLSDKRIILWKGAMIANGFKIKYAEKLAFLYKNNNDFAAAHTIYEQIQNAAPRKFQYLVDDGNLYLLEGNSKKAFEKF